MSLVTVSLRSRVDEASTSGGYKGGPKCADGFARDGNPMFTGGEIKLKLVSISFSAFVTVPPCVYIPVFYLFKSPADSESFFFPPLVPSSQSTTVGLARTLLFPFVVIVQRLCAR